MRALPFNGTVQFELRSGVFGADLAGKTVYVRSNTGVMTKLAILIATT
jgi:hypothetical protein